MTVMEQIAALRKRMRELLEQEHQLNAEIRKLQAECRHGNLGESKHISGHEEGCSFNYYEAACLDCGVHRRRTPGEFEWR